MEWKIGVAVLVSVIGGMAMAVVGMLAICVLVRAEGRASRSGMWTWGAVLLVVAVFPCAVALAVPIILYIYRWLENIWRWAV